jgi:3-oxoacyl-[acyl-carrier-protein] synthase II
MEIECLKRFKKETDEKTGLERWVLLEKWMHEVSLFAIPMVIPNSASGNIAQYFKFNATECPAVSSSCTSGASAIAMAFDKIKLGYVPLMVCGGVGDANVATIYAAYGNMRILSKNSNPDEACRPFDRGRDGIVLGDGAGILVLEELEHAKSRGAKIYGELFGYGDFSDTTNSIRPDKNGKALSKAISLALQRSRLNANQVDYINAHGASSRTTDIVESNGIISAFGERAYRIPINSTKSMIGHTSGGAAALELIVSLLSIRDNVIHQTRNYKEKDLECPLDYTPNEPRPLKINYAISNSIGILGPSMALCIGRYNGD